jgi:processive 1,2-diacylglycerol beta-glucosyltransferase
MANDRPILILAASTGAGHLMAAHALEQVIREQRPDLPVQTHDLLESTNVLFRTLYARGYLGIVNYAPTAMGLLYDATDQPNGTLRHALRTGFQNLNVRPAVHELTRLRPRLIINTHFFPAEIVARLRRSRRLDCPHVIVTTDFETHRIWAQQPAERFYTATEQGKAYLAACGVDPRSIRLTGIPVRPAFARTESRRALRGRLGLATNPAVVLLLCGGFGVGPTKEIFRELLDVGLEAQVVAVAGKNVRLRERLDSLAQRSGRPARVIGYTDAIHEWMHAADLAVTKPGGLTTAEALVCGLPLVIVRPIPGPETRNSDYLLEHAAAIKVNNVRLLRYRIEGLLDDRERLGRLRRNAAALGRPDAAERIAADALSLIGEVAVPAPPPRGSI